MGKFLGKWYSRKLFVACGSVLTVVLTNIGLPEQIAEQITEAVVYISGAFLVGQGAADAAKEFKATAAKADMPDARVNDIR